MNNEAFEAMKAVYQLAGEKAKYNREILEWKRPEGIRGLFARPPRDPFPEGMEALRDCLRTSFGRAFPEMEAFRAGDESVSDQYARFHVDMDYEGRLNAFYHSKDRISNVFHDEHFEFAAGYGFRHGYQQDPNPEKDAANRNYAYRRAMETRIDAPFFKSFEKQMDKLRDDLSVLAKGGYERRQILDAVRKAKAWSAEDRRMTDTRRETVKSYCFTADSFDSFIGLKGRMEQVRQDVISGRQSAGDRQLQENFHAMEGVAYGYLSKSFGDDVARLRDMKQIDPNQMMSFSKTYYEMETGRNPDLPENKPDALCVFASLARKDGWTRDDISSAVAKEASAYGVGLSYRSSAAITEAVDKVDADRRREVESAVRMGVRDGKSSSMVCSEIKGKVRTNRIGEVHLVDAVLAAKRHLDGVNLLDDSGKLDVDKVAKTVVKQGAYQVFSDDLLAMAVAVSVGRGMHSRTAEVLEKDLGSKLDAAFADAYLRRMETKSLSQLEKEIDSVMALDRNDADRWARGRSTESNPVTILAKDIAAAAYGMKEKSPEKLGPWLRELGMDLTQGGLLMDSVCESARRMYGRGDEKSAAAVAKFRTGMAGEIDAGRAILKSERLANGIQAGVRKENKMGLSM